MDPTKRRSAEAKRANVIYFLSRHGRIEHPHLIRIHHFCHSGVRLRDVKRWLAEVRGKEMPDSFFWSYQRRYKNGFVWQDVTDDDLIAPISDNEYVLLGSLAPSATDSKPDFLSSSDQADNAEEKEQLGVSDGEPPVPDSPVDDGPHNQTKDQGGSPAKDVGGRSCPWLASEMFRTFLACKAVATDDSAHLSVPRRVAYDDEDCGNGGGVVGGAKTCRGDGYGWVTRAGGSVWPAALHRSSQPNDYSRESRPAGGGKSSRKAGRKQMSNPRCSQCGRPFNPEKLLSHMESCRGLRRSGSFRCSLENII